MGEKGVCEVDHEVSVVVESKARHDDPHDKQTASSFDWTITAMSVGHEITQITLWLGDGSTGLVIEEKSLTKDAPKDVETPDGKKDAKRVIGKINLNPNQSTHYCVDVSEAANTAGEEDIHRHGWFNIEGTLRSGQGHQLEAAKCQDPKLKGWYPKMDEGKKLKPPKKYEFAPVK